MRLRQLWKSRGILGFIKVRGNKSKTGETNVSENKDRLKRVAKSLNDLRSLVAQDEEGFEKFVAPNLTFGDVWLIPDEVSGFGTKVHHPWVIVRGYSPRQSNVVACPRTTKLDNQNGLLVPAGTIQSFDKDGVILLRHRRSFIAKDFTRFTYLERLPDPWCEDIHSFLQTIGR